MMTICRQKGDGDAAGEKRERERKTKPEVVGQHQERLVGENCRGRKRNTELNGGVSQETSTPPT